MNKVVLAVALTLVSSFALANPQPPTSVTTTSSNSYLNSQNSNSNKNRNSNRNSNKNTNKNSATGGNASQSQNQSQGQNQAQSANANIAGVGNGSNTTTINDPKNPVTSAYAASLTSGFDTCSGSVSGGIQTQVLGLSAGKTNIDKNCILIKQVQLLRELGYDNAACFRARSGEEGKAIDDAMTKAGVDCSNVAKPVVVVPVQSGDTVTHEELNKVVEHALAK